MTTAKIKSKLPTDGHGLTHRLADAYFHARAKGEPSDDLIVVGRLSSIGHGEEKGKPWVSFEFAALEIVAEDWERANVRDILTNASDKRHGGAQIPIDFDQRSDDDQRRFLLGLIEDDWAKEESLTPADVQERWRSFWGIEVESDDGAFPRMDYRKAAAHHLKEFAFQVGVLADGEPDELPLDDVDAVDGK